MSHLRAVRDDDEPAERQYEADLVEVVDSLVEWYGAQSGLPLDDLAVLLQTARDLARFQYPCPVCAADPFGLCTDPDGGYAALLHDARVVGDNPPGWLSFRGTPRH